jgi:cytochrome c oxidase subunit 2
MIRHPLRAAAFAMLFACSCGGQGQSETADDATPVKITAMQWSFSPSVVMLQKGATVDFQLTSADVHHRFYVPEFGIDVDVLPGQTTSVKYTPDAAGTFPFRCEYYCGTGHEGMVGQLVVQ